MAYHCALFPEDFAYHGSPVMPKKPDQPASFEGALAELEKLVARMEAGELSLEQSLEAHKRGIELAQYCQSVLGQAQQQVKVLEENALKNFPRDSDPKG